MRRALIVDDDPTSCQLIARFLSPLEFESDFAMSGAEAYDKISATDYDVVISDVRMPNGSGIDLLRALQSGKSHVPVLLISAEVEGAKSQAKAMGASAFLLKPLNRDDLREAIERICGELSLVQDVTESTALSTSGTTPLSTTSICSSQIAGTQISSSQLGSDQLSSDSRTSKLRDSKSLGSNSLN